MGRVLISLSVSLSLFLSLPFVDRTTEWQSNRFTSLYGYGQPMRENQLFRV